MYKHVFRLGAAALAVSLLVACGGGGERVMTPPSGGNSGFTPPQSGQSATGYFLDAAVAGVEVWQGGKKVSTTDRDGKFTFTAGQAAEFRIGKLVLGSTTPIEVVTPADLTRDADQTVTLLQLLQGLDADGQPDNGITISAANVQALEKLSKPVKAADSADIAALKQQLPGVAIKDVTEQQALEHFAKTNTAKHTSVAAVAKQIPGYWFTQCNRGFVTMRHLRPTARPSVFDLVTEIDRTYENDNCTGEIAGESVYNYQPGEYTWHVAGHSRDGKEEVTTILEYDRSQYAKSGLEVDSQRIKWISKDRVERLTQKGARPALRGKGANDWAAANPPAKPGNTGNTGNAEMTPAKLVTLLTSNAWTSNCMASDSGGFKRYVIEPVKIDATSFMASRNVKLRFDNASCSGAPTRIENNAQYDEQRLTDQPHKNTQGHWVFKESSGDRSTLTLTSNTTFTAQYISRGKQKTEHFTVSDKAEFERLWKQAQ